MPYSNWLTGAAFFAVSIVAIAAAPDVADYDTHLCQTAQRLIINADADFPVIEQRGTSNGFHTIQMSVDDEHWTKPGEMSVDDVVAFLSGDVDLQLDFDAIELPPELGEDTPKPASSPPKSRAAPSLVEDLDGLPCAGKALFN